VGVSTFSLKRRRPSQSAGSCWPPSSRRRRERGRGRGRGRTTLASRLRRAGRRGLFTTTCVFHPSQQFLPDSPPAATPAGSAPSRWRGARQPGTRTGIATRTGAPWPRRRPSSHPVSRSLLTPPAATPGSPPAATPGSTPAAADGSAPFVW